MAQTSIGRAALVLTTNGSAVKPGLDTVGAQAAAWAKRTGGQITAGLAKGGGGAKGVGEAVGSQLAGLTAVSGGLFAGLGVTIGAAVGGPIGATIGGVIGGAIGAIGGETLQSVKSLTDSVVGVLGKAKDTLTDISRQGDIASAIGLTAEQFTGIAGVAKSAGEDTREFIESLVTLGKLGTDAASGTKEASAAFKGLGLDAAEFIKLRADQQFFGVFEALNKVNDPLQRTRFLMQAFGEDGGKFLLPLLSKTPDQLRQMASGFSLTGEQVKKASATTAAWSLFGAVTDKVWRGISIVAAGPLEMIANGAGRALSAVQPVFDFVQAGAERVTTGVRNFFDGVEAITGRLWSRLQPQLQPLFNYLESGWNRAKFVADITWEGLQSLAIPVIEKVVQWTETAITAVADWMNVVFETGTRWKPLGDVVVETFRTVGSAAALTWDVIKAGAGVFAFVAGQGVMALGKLVQANTDVIKELARLGFLAAKANGLDGVAQKFLELGASAEGLGPKIAASGLEMMKWGKGAVDGIGKGAAEFNGWLDRMLARQKDVTEEAAAVAVAGAQKASAAMKSFDNAALLKGSSAEVSARVQYEMGKDGVAAAALAEHKKANQLLAAAVKGIQEVADSISVQAALLPF